MEKVGTAHSKFPVVGMKDRATNQDKAEVVEATDKLTLQGFVHRNTEPDDLVYTVEAKAYIYTWKVASQPWEVRDRLMVRIRDVE
ncbi:MAG: hypothetical protein OXD46_12560 [Chloroflexi bacterium]|nr:hypothetical protein [Chloroflexota bacterium]